MCSFSPKYQIHKDGKVIGKVIKEWNIPTPSNYKTKGSFVGHDFKYTQEGAVVVLARANKNYFQFTNTYGVEIL
jgi:uncharacterized protein YxjI